MCELIPAGQFQPRRGKPVDLEAFQIARYPVTNAQFALFIEAGGYYDSQWDDCWGEQGLRYRADRQWRASGSWYNPQFNKANQPVVGVSWFEAIAYANWLNVTTSRNYRLPTEFEWERAAGHTDGREYPWGAEWGENHANIDETGLQRTSVVGMLPNGLASCQAADVAGNVWEWTFTETIWIGEEIARVLRGGSWAVDRRYAQIGLRYFLPPDFRGSVSGFRLLCPNGREG